MLNPNFILQDRYRIVRQLGQGGMGTVYEAIDQRVSCLVALKEILGEIEQETRRAFEREAALLANLRHPSLPKVMDHFTEGDGQFLVMEFIPGLDLAELLEVRGHAFPPEQVLRWADELLKVLEYLHARQPPILHRDIKPSNLKITKQGEIFLLDFGLAKGSAGQMPTLMTSRSVRGYTPVYAPLEQIMGKGTDTRSDLYSLGATLYHLLTASLPADAPTRFAAIEDEQPDPLRSIDELNPQVTPAIAAVIQRAMAISRKGRPASAAEMRRALREAEAEMQRAAEERRRAEMEQQRAAAEALRRQAEEEERQQREAEEAEHRRAEEEAARNLAAEQEAARLRAEEERARVEEEQQRTEAEAERQRAAAEAERKHLEEARRREERERLARELEEAERQRQEERQREQLEVETLTAATSPSPSPVASPAETPRVAPAQTQRSQEAASADSPAVKTMKAPPPEKVVLSDADTSARNAAAARAVAVKRNQRVMLAGAAVLVAIAAVVAIALLRQSEGNNNQPTVDNQSQSGQAAGAPASNTNSQPVQPTSSPTGQAEQGNVPSGSNKNTPSQTPAGSESANKTNVLGSVARKPAAPSKAATGPNRSQGTSAAERRRRALNALDQ